jgi:acyl carrier protein
MAEVFSENVATEAGIKRLRDWILERNPELDDVPADADIIDNRLITSLQFVGFMLFIEELRGAPLKAEEVNIESFRTLRAINNTFLEGKN